MYRRARSSAGRAPAWHAGGRKFDPCRVHHFNLYPLVRVGFLLRCFSAGALPCRCGWGDRLHCGGLYLNHS